MLDPTDKASIVWHQTITADSECRLTADPLPIPDTNPVEYYEPLLSFGAFNPEAPTADDQYAGFADASLGSRYVKKGKQSEGKGQACGEVNGDLQGLVVSVEGGFVIGRVEADIESKYNADTKLEALSQSRYAAENVLDVKTFNTTQEDSDSSPDSKGSDNDRVVWDLTATTPKAVALSPTVLDANGDEDASSSNLESVAVGLEGGGDGVPGAIIGEPDLATGLDTNATLFEVLNADGLLNCGDEASESFDTVIGGVTYTGEITVKRLSQVDCTVVPYSLDIADVSSEATTLPNGRTLAVVADFLYPVTEGFSATLSVKHPPLDPTAYEASGPIGPTDWEPGIELYTDYGYGPVEIPWCDGFIDDPAIPQVGEVDGGLGAYPGEGSCIFERSETLPGTVTDGPNGFVTITEGVYLNWDYRTLR